MIPAHLHPGVSAEAVRLKLQLHLLTKRKVDRVVPHTNHTHPEKDGFRSWSRIPHHSPLLDKRQRDRTHAPPCVRQHTARPFDPFKCFLSCVHSSVLDRIVRTSKLASRRAKRPSLWLELSSFRRCLVASRFPRTKQRQRENDDGSLLRSYLGKSPWIIY